VRRDAQTIVTPGDSKKHPLRNNPHGTMPAHAQGPRHPLMRPVIHGSRVVRKKAAKQLAEERAPW